MRLTDVGRLGIGTTSPGEMLHVQGSAYVNNYLTFPVASAVTGVVGAGNPLDTFTVDSDKVLNHYGLAWKSFSDVSAGPVAALSGYGGVRVYTLGVERMRIDQNGAVNLANNTTVNGNILLSNVNPTITFNSGGSYISNANTANTLIIGTSGLERMRVNSDGNVLIGTSASSGYKLEVNGSARFQTGIQVGRENSASEGGQINLCRAVDNTESYSIDVYGNNTTPDLRFIFGTSTRAYFTGTNGDFRPGNDNGQNLGGPANRWATVYAGTGSINTSDANLKEQVQSLDAAELAVATRIKGLIKKFKFKDAVAAKGANARIHVGVIAQEVQAAFAAEGLDASKYALFCLDEITDDNGNTSTRLGIRYEELLAFVIAAL